jgi:Transcription initiation factor IID, 18kD subunit
MRRKDYHGVEFQAFLFVFVEKAQLRVRLYCIQHGDTGQEGRRRNGGNNEQYSGLQIYPGNIPNGIQFRASKPGKHVYTPQMFVFGEVQDPNPDTVNLVEDIVRSQLIELVSDCPLLAVW